MIPDWAESVLAFGWAVVDPWDAVWRDSGCMVITDAGPVCPVCGWAAPVGEGWPHGVTMRDPANHGPECELAKVLRENP